MIKIGREVQGQAGEGCGGLKSRWEGAAQPEDPPSRAAVQTPGSVCYLPTCWLALSSFNTEAHELCRGILIINSLILKQH